jgi:hypothetical protein
VNLEESDALCWIGFSSNARDERPDYTPRRLDASTPRRLDASTQIERLAAPSDMPPIL